MTINKIYTCNLCGGTAEPQKNIDQFFFGLSWADFPHGWKRLNVNQADKHICKTCLISLSRIASEVFPNNPPKTEIEEVLREIEMAYPKDIFSDTAQGERDDVGERYPGFIDRTSAMMGRHLVNAIRQKFSL